MKLATLLLTTFICTASLYAQSPQFQAEWLDNPRDFKTELLTQFDLQELEEFEYNLPDDAVLLENGYAKYTIKNAEDWEDTKVENIPTDIFVVYTKYPKRKEDWRTNYHDLLANRLVELFKIDPTLNDTKIKWHILLQTNCNTEAEAKRLFHGIIVYYKPKIAATDLTSVTFEEEEDSDAEIDTTTSFKKEKNDKPIPTIALSEINTNELEEVESTDLVERMKSELSEEDLKKVKTKEDITEAYIESIPENKPEDFTPAFVEDRTNKLKEFMEEHGSQNEAVNTMLSRQKDWKNSLVVMDWTGSMYTYGAEVMLWHLLNFETSEVQHFVFFNDGDGKSTSQKVIGSTGGIYSQDATNIDQLLGLFRYVMSKGAGGDGPENDIEAILEGIKRYPEVEQVVLIADNNACVRDMELLDKVTKPVKVILCGYKDFSGANPQYLEIAYKTGGSVHTTTQDITNLSEEMLNPEGDLEIKNDKDEFLMMVRSSCRRMYWRESDRKALTIKTPVVEPEYEKKVYYSVESAVAKADSAYRLNISNKQLTEMPLAVTKDLTLLKAVDVSYNNIEKLPKELAALENLRELDLSHNKLRRIPSDLSKLPKLAKIEADNNALKSVPNEIVDITSLTVLNLSHNELRKVPKRVQTLENLEELDVSHNQLRKLPVDLGQLRNLRILNFEHNDIEAFPEWVGGWRTLEFLDLSDNEITGFVGSLKAAKKLRVLDASNNNITQSLNVLTALKELTELDLSNNQIKKIPSGFGNFKNLEVLDLSHNNIVSIHYRINRVRSLKQLKLNDNNLRRLPKELVNLKQLRLLDISNNPISDAEYERIKKAMPWCVVKR